MKILQIKSDTAVECLGELIATHPEVANIIIDVTAGEFPLKQ